MKNLKIYLGFALLICGTLFSSCQEEKSVNSKVVSTVTKISSDTTNKEKAEKVKGIFVTLPSPMDLYRLFKKEGIRFNIKLLHNTSARKEYQTSIKKALNLGVYGADLSFAGLNSEHEASIECFASCQRLAADLGVGNAFQNRFISRLEQNANNKDTLLSVIADFFAFNDLELHGENHQDISTYILAGGWIEGIYLGTSMTSVSTDLNGIRELILDQKNSLHNLIYLLQSVKQNPQSIKLAKDFGELEVLYHELESNSEPSLVSEEYYNNLRDKIIILREGIISF